MTDDAGKVGRAFFEEHLAGRLGAARGDVSLGPNHGVDFGVIAVGDRAVVLATDPVWVLPELGWERAAWFAFHICLSDVAVSGLEPTHLAVDLNLPPDATDEQFDRIWSVFDREARDLNIAIVTGHTGRYANCAYPTIGGATALAVGEPDSVVCPDGARPGDRVLVTKGPAVEATGLLAARFEPLLREELPGTVVDDAIARFTDMSPVRDALIAATAGPVTAMHDATEGGLLHALRETAAASETRVAVDRDRMPVLPGVREVCEATGMDPWIASSEGTLVVTVQPGGVDPVLDALDSRGTPAAEVGEVRQGAGLVVDGTRVDDLPDDPLWETYKRYETRERS